MRSSRPGPRGWRSVRRWSNGSSTSRRAPRGRRDRRSRGWCACISRRVPPRARAPDHRRALRRGRDLQRPWSRAGGARGRAGDPSRQRSASPWSAPGEGPLILSRPPGSSAAAVRCPRALDRGGAHRELEAITAESERIDPRAAKGTPGRAAVDGLALYGSLRSGLHGSAHAADQVSREQGDGARSRGDDPSSSTDEARDQRAGTRSPGTLRKPFRAGGSAHSRRPART